MTHSSGSDDDVMDPKMVLISVITVGAAVATNGECNGRTQLPAVVASEEVVFDEPVVSFLAFVVEVTAELKTWDADDVSELQEMGEEVPSLGSQEGSSFPGGSSSDILVVTATEALLVPRDVSVGEGTFLKPKGDVEDDTEALIALQVMDSGI